MSLTIRSGTLLGPRGLSGILAPSSIFKERVLHLEASESQVEAKKLANQLYYNVESQTGQFYGYAGWAWSGATAHGAGYNWNQSTVPLYIVPRKQPTVKVWLVTEESSGPEETIRSSPELQALLESVPLPTLANLPKKQIQAVGTDAEAVAWQPSTDRMWEFHRLGQFKEGAHKGEWKCGAAHYQGEVSRWRGVCEPPGQVSASRFGIALLTVLHSDIVQALRGGKIEHALGLVASVTGKGFVAPATAHDAAGGSVNTAQFLPDKVTPNPAFGEVDLVAEGLCVRFPQESHPHEYGLTGPVEAAFYEAMREFGFYVRDSGAKQPKFIVADARTLNTEYSHSTVNPLYGNSIYEAYTNENASETVIRSRFDPTLPLIDNEIQAALEKMPWRTLEQVKPRSA